MGLNQSKKKHRKKFQKGGCVVIPIEKKIFPSSINLVLLGDGSVGKSSICNSFFGQEFEQFEQNTFYSLSNEKFEKKYLLDNGKEIKLIIWDTPGYERFRRLVLKPIKSAQGFVLVFDVTNRKSFDNLEEWLDIIKENSEKKHIICLFGNKVDVDKEKWTVKNEEIEKFAEMNALKYFDISAKYTKGIFEGFNFLINKIYNHHI